MADTISYRGSQYYHYREYDNGNVGISNGKWNHVFFWYEYADPSENGYDHPKHIESSIDADGVKWNYWVYEHDENSPTGYPTVSGDGANLSAGSGNDTITNAADNCILNGDAGNDKLVNTGQNAVIYGGAGNDEITNGGDNSHINGGEGKNNVYNNGDKVTITGGADNDSIVNDGSQVSINAGNGKNIIYNTSGADSVTIISGSGDDSIDNNGDNVIISGVQVTIPLTVRVLMWKSRRVKAMIPLPTSARA